MQASQSKVVGSSSVKGLVSTVPAPAGHAPGTADARPSEEGHFVFVPGPSPRVESKVDSCTPFFSLPLVRRGMLLGKGVSSGALPPPIKATPCGSTVFRFVSTSTSLVPVTAKTLAGAIGGVCTVANSTVVAWASSVLVSHIRVWPASGGSATLSWDASNDTAEDSLVDLSIPTGITMTKCLEFKPPKNAQAGFWNVSSGNTALFDIASAVGSIVDVHVNYRLSAAILPGSESVTTGTLGTVYYLALDGPASNKYTPVALPTTH